MPVISADFEYYADVLQVSYDGAVNDLKSAYDGIARYLHPKNGGSAKVFQEVSNAYSILLEHLGGNEASEKTEATTLEPASTFGGGKVATNQDEPRHAETDAGSFASRLDDEPTSNKAQDPPKRPGEQQTVRRRGASHHCLQCPRTFPDKSRLREHLRTHTGEKPFECHECGKRYARRGALNVHRLSHSGEKPHACEECGRRFTLRTQLSQHRESACGTKKRFECERCQKKFTARRSLLQHIRSIHEHPQLHRCDECGKTVSRARNLARHRRTHSGERPYECEVCGAKFAQSQSLRKHIARVH